MNQIKGSKFEENSLALYTLQSLLCNSTLVVINWSHLDKYFLDMGLLKVQIIVSTGMHDVSPLINRCLYLEIQGSQLIDVETINCFPVFNAPAGYCRPIFHLQANIVIPAGSYFTTMLHMQACTILLHLQANLGSFCWTCRLILVHLGTCMLI